MFETGSPAAALEVLDTATPAQAAALRLKLLRLRVLLALGHDEAAQALCSDILRQRPGLRWVRRAAIDLALAQGDIGQAISLADTGAAARPDDPGLALHHVQLLQKAGRPAATRVALGRLTARFPGFAAGWFARAEEARRHGGEVEALSASERALALQPTRARFRRQSIALAERQGAFERGLRLCWADPGRLADEIPEVPSRALPLSLRVFGASAAMSLLERCIAALPEIATSELPGLARFAEAQAAPQAAAACYRALGARADWPLATALVLLRRAHATGDATLTDGLLRLARDKVEGAEARQRLEVEADRVTRGSEAALARLRRSATARLRSPADALALANLLLASGHGALAIRYLRRCARAWPERAEMAELLVRARALGGDIDGADRALDDLKRRFPARDLRALTCHLHLVAHRRAEAAALLRAGLDAPDGPLRPLDALCLAVSLGDVAMAERAAASLRAQPNAPARLTRHFNVTHPGALLTDLRLFAALPTQDAAEPAPVAQYFSAASQALDAVETELAAPPGAPGPIPRRILQYWHADARPMAVARLMQDWAGIDGVAYLRLDHHSARRWLLEQFDAEHARAFSRAPHVAHAADFLRLCGLLKRGGLYLDADTKCTGPIDPLLAEAGELLLFREPQGALANDMICAVPNHPAIARAVDMARAALLAQDNEPAWTMTGPGLLTRAVMAHLATTGRPDPDHLRVLPYHRLRRHLSPGIDLPYKATPAYWNAHTGQPHPEIRDALVSLARAGRRQATAATAPDRDTA